MPNSTNQDLWQEFSNIRNWANNQDFGSNPWDRLSVQGAVTFPVNTITAAYTLGDRDFLVIANTASGDFTVTLPSAVTMRGRYYVIMNTGANAATIATTGGQTINGNSTVSLPFAYTGLQFFSDGSNWVAI